MLFAKRPSCKPVRAPGARDWVSNGEKGKDRPSSGTCSTATRSDLFKAPEPRCIQFEAIKAIYGDRTQIK